MNEIVLCENRPELTNLTKSCHLAAWLDVTRRLDRAVSLSAERPVETHLDE
jgi:hypothetical protein